MNNTSKFELPRLSLRVILFILVLYFFQNKDILSKALTFSDETAIAFKSGSFAFLTIPLILFSGLLGWIAINGLFFRFTKNSLFAKFSTEEKKDARIFIVAVLIITFLICSVLFILGSGSKTVIFENGEIKSYSIFYKEKDTIPTEDIESATLTPKFQGKRNATLYAVLTLKLKDSKAISFDSRNFKDNIKMKEFVFSFKQLQINTDDFDFGDTESYNALSKELYETFFS